MSHQPDRILQIGRRQIGLCHPTYFIADIAANHDGDLARAKELIALAARAGADAAKFQHFTAKTIVSDFGFKNLGSQQSHQSRWKKSVFEVYDEAALNADWTPDLKAACDAVGIDFFTSPYSLELVDFVDPYVSAFKIGSGDITWLEIVERMASKGKPVILATGASTLDDVVQAVDAILERTPQVALMQCNTNYTGRLENFGYIELNVLKTYAAMYPELILGLSDHTPGHATVLGSVALGARVIEKHFTDEISRVGPDHAFSMDPASWREMVDRTRELELALGTGVKRVEPNEADTVVLQRRAIRACGPLRAGKIIEADDVEVLRPCPRDGLPPHQLSSVVGRSLVRDLAAGQHLRWTDLD